MIKTLLIPVFLLLSIPGVGQSNSVTLSGKLVNFTNQEEVQDLSDLQYLLPATMERIIVADSTGKFKIKFSLTSPNYFRLGRNILYLSPGDNLSVIVDKNKPGEGKFEGRGAAENLYLRHTPFPKGGSFLEAGRRVQKSAKATIDTILRIAEERLVVLNNTEGLDKEFVRLEQARIKADLINSLRAGLASYRPRISQDSLATYTKEYTALAQPIIAKHSKGFLDTSLLKIVVYRDIVSELLKHNNEASVRHFKEWQQAERLVREMKTHSDKAILTSYKARVDSFSIPDYRSAMTATLQNLLKFGKGDPAADFVVIDMNGKKTRLSSLKGKVIYIDLWATWCGPCLAEMPQFEKLKEKFSTNSKVAIVSLSIDDNKDLWMKNVLARKADGIQWQINRNALNDYDIVTIPRTLVIDKNFRMVDLNGPLPSSKAAVELIDSLLEIK